MKARLPRRRIRRSHAGVILLVVLVVVVALSVTVYTFSRRMLIDSAITRAHVDSSQQRLLCESVVEQLLASDRQSLQQLCLPTSHEDARSNASNSSELRVRNLPGIGSMQLLDYETGYMAILACDPRSDERQLGLRNESAKLNLSSLAGRRLSRKQVIDKLMKYKELSEPTAEGIANLLGIFDSQTNVQMGSVVADQSAPPVPATRLTSIAQLLDVPGVTEERLLGEDRNANGILDGNENDGDATWPPDNADGVLDAGWSAHWTLIGAESNFRNKHDRKIDLNQTDLVSLYDQVSQFATPDEARFVVAWRISSPVYTDSSAIDEVAQREQIANELATSFDERLANQLGTNTPVTGQGETRGSVSPTETNQPKIRAGLNLGVSSARRFRSLLELASCQLQLIVDGKDTILVSPFANDPASLSRWLPLWEERTSVMAGAANTSRINVMQASPATLTTVEGITHELADAIVRQRTSLYRSESKGVSGSPVSSVGWLLEAGLVTSAELRAMADEITVGGDVYQGFAIGQLQKSRTACVKFIELDGRSGALKVRRALDMPVLSATKRLRIVE